MIFLLIFAFITADDFIPLLLTAVRGRSLAEAGIVITAGTVSWSLGSWWQSRAIATLSRLMLARLSIALVIVGLLGVIATLAGAALAVPYIAWFIGGVGMGIAFPTAYLVVMDGATDTGAGVAVSSADIAERLGLALGGGLGGAAIALALAVHASLTVGLGGALLLALMAALGALAIAPRLTPASGAASQTAN
jgi:MFS family permease